MSESITPDADAPENDAAVSEKAQQTPTAPAESVENPKTDDSGTGEPEAEKAGSEKPKTDASETDDARDDEIRKLNEQLDKANHDVAIMQVRIDHPDFTDEDVALLGTLDSPEAVKTWADAIQQIIDRHSKDGDAPAKTVETSSGKELTGNDLNNEVAHAFAHPTSVPKAKSSDLKDLYNRQFNKYAPSTHRKD